MKNKLIVLSMLITGLLMTPFSSVQANSIGKNAAKDSRAAYVIDAKSGQVLYQKNANQKIPIASLAKIMTLYLTSEAIKSGKLRWNQEVTISKPLVDMSKSKTLGSFKMDQKKKYTIRQLYQATLVASSNSAAITLGEQVAGNNNTFIDRMNAQAKDWNLDADFVSSSGLENGDLKKYDYTKSGTDDKAGNQVSAKAITTVAQKLVDDYPYVKDWSSASKLKVADQELVNSNRLLKGDTFYVADHNVDGLKTGYTEDAGLCLIATFHQDGRELISTVLGSNSSFSTTNTLIDKIDDNLTYGNIEVKDRTYSQQNTTVKATPTEKKVALWHDKTDPLQGIETNVTKSVSNEAPVVKGEKIANVKVDSKNYPYKTNVKLVANKNVGSKKQVEKVKEQEKQHQRQKQNNESLWDRIKAFFGFGVII